MTNQDDYPNIRDIRDEVHKEHTLLNQRVLWLVTSQSFLFVPLAVGIERASRATNSDAIKIANTIKIKDSLFFPLIPQLGILICIVAFIGIIAAICSLSKWKKLQYEKQKGKEKIKKTRWIVPVLGLVPAIAIPIFIACGWYSILNGQDYLCLWQWFAK